MSNRYINWLSGTLLGAAVLTGFTACSDDHFDINTSGSSAATIWQNLSEQPKLSDFGNILSRTITLRNLNDKNSQQTYSELLNKQQVLTIWAPENGTFDAARWNHYLDLAADYRQKNQLDSALYYNYKVQYQFLNQHIANFSYESLPADQSIRLLNSKLAVYNVADKTFNSVPLDAALPTIPSSNGTLHLLNGYSVYQYHIYDLMGSESNLSDIYNSIISKNETKFYAPASTAGGVDDKGNTQYIDSVFITTNSFLLGCGASIQNEDSNYVAVIPSNVCWPKASEKMMKMFNYKSSYANKWSSANRDFTYKGDKGYQVTNPDSLSKANAESLIMNNMFFSVSKQRNVTSIDQTDSAQVINFMQTLDTLNTTVGYAIVNASKGSKNPIFGNANPKRASNGYVYEIDDYNYVPEHSYQVLSSIHPLFSFAASTMRDGDQAGANYVALTDKNRDSTIYFTPSIFWDAEKNESFKIDDADSSYFNASRSSYLRMQRNTATSTNYVDFKLQNVFSAKYDVYACIFPSEINVNDSAYLGQGKKESIIFSAEMLDDEGKTLAKVDKVTPPQAVSVVKLFSDFKFEYCYNSLPSTVETFPRLRINLPAPRQAKSCNALNINYIWLVPKGL